jgi:hypothetical protein
MFEYRFDTLLKFAETRIASRARGKNEGVEGKLSRSERLLGEVDPKRRYTFGISSHLY